MSDDQVYCDPEYVPNTSMPTPACIPEREAKLEAVRTNDAKGYSEHAALQMFTDRRWLLAEIDRLNDLEAELVAAIGERDRYYEELATAYASVRTMQGKVGKQASSFQELVETE